MNKLLFILLLLSFQPSMAQQPYLPSTDGTPVSRPLGATGFPTDARSKFHERSPNFLYRDYQNTTEVLSTLNSANSRKGNFPIFIHVGGTLLSSGLYTGGTTETYVFKDCLSDSCLVPMNTNGSTVTYAVDSTDAKGAMVIYLYGNSLSYSAGATPRFDYLGGVSWAENLKRLSGYNVIPFAISGQTSQQISARFFADIAAHPERKQAGFIFEMGGNNAGQPLDVFADNQRVVDSLKAWGNTKYLIFGMGGHSSSTYWQGTSDYNNIKYINDTLRVRFAGHFADVRPKLVAAYNPAIPQDTMDHFHDIPPTSLMYTDDVVHFNDKGYEIYAQTAYENIGVFKPLNNKVVTTASLWSIFNNAPTVNTPTLLAKRAAIGYSQIQDATYIDGNNQPDMSNLSVNGNVIFMNNRAASDKIGGIAFRNYYSDQGGRANKTMMGTNLSVWNPSKGLIVRNDVAQFDFGTNVTVSGDISGVSNYLGANFKASSSIYSPIFSIGDPVTHQALRPIDFTQSGIGMMPPTMNQAQITAQDASGDGTVKTRISEFVWNSTTNRPMFAVDAFNGYGTYKTIPNVDDLTALPYRYEPGAGMSRTGSGSVGDPYIFNNTSVPPPTKLTGTIYDGFFPSESPYQATKAFDDNTATAYVSSPNDVYPNPYIGLVLANPNVITKIRIWPFSGQTIEGAKIQGSNTSMTSGFVDLLTLPNVPFFQWSVYSISTLTGYKYIRLYNASSVYQLAVYELEFYGYERLGLTVEAPLVYNDTTKVLSISGTVGGLADLYVDTTLIGNGTFASPLGVDTTNRIQTKLILTTNFTSGPSTLSGRTLNIPQYSGGGGTGGGDASTNTSTSVDGEALVFSGTSGKTAKRFSGTGYVKAAAGVLSAAAIPEADLPVLTGYTSGPGTVSATDTYRQAIQKLNGNVAANLQRMLDSITAVKARDSAQIFFDTAHFAFAANVLQLRYPSHSRGTPTFVMTGGGTSPTITVTGTDVAGVINITTAASGGSLGILNGTLTFAAPYASAPPCSVTPGSSSIVGVFGFTSSGTALNIGTNFSLAFSTTYKIYYSIPQ